MSHRGHGWRPLLLSTGKAVLFLGLLWALYGRWFSLSVMLSDSMAPTLRATFWWQDLVLEDRLSLRFRTPRRGDILHLPATGHQERSVSIYKRVAGLPGEQVEIREGVLLVNGKPVRAPSFFQTQVYTNEGHASPGVILEIASDSYFLLGDNSLDSLDSRYWGAVKLAEVSGLAAARIWPIHRIRPLALPAERSTP